MHNSSSRSTIKYSFALLIVRKIVVWILRAQQVDLYKKHKTVTTLDLHIQQKSSIKRQPISGYDYSIDGKKRVNDVFFFAFPRHSLLTFPNTIRSSNVNQVTTEPSSKGS